MSGTATLKDGLGYKITSDGAEYNKDVKIELDNKGQLDRVEAICGEYWACNGTGRRVRLDLQEGMTQEEGLSDTDADLLTAILDATGSLPGQSPTLRSQVLIQAWPANKNEWALLIICVADGTTPGDLNIEDPSEYKFWSCGEGEDEISLLHFGLSYPGAVKPQGTGPSWTITPSDPSNGPVKLYVMKKTNPKFRHWTPEFLATFSSLPFEMEVTLDGAGKPAVPPVSSSTWGQVKEQAK